MLNYKYNAYKSNILANLDMGQQIALIYDKVILLIQKSKEFIVNGKSLERFKELEQAKQIVDDMSVTLDRTQEDRLIGVLESFYLGVYCNISELEFTKDIKRYDDIVEELKLVRDEWKKISRQ